MASSTQRSDERQTLHRRRISSALQRLNGWTVRTNVDGYVEVTLPRDRRGDDDSFAGEVSAAVVALRYTPTVTRSSDKHGGRIVKLRT
jgi:hypothetical protein